ncbi:divergent PAP2 family protein [bacterium]|nr:divergent PAP2 family protein [bacterium]
MSISGIALATYYPLIAGIFGMLSAQGLKMVIGCIKNRRIDLSPFTNPGGMPSSHTAMVTALSCAVGLQEGWNSPAFAISVIFSLIVLYDAAGVRYAAGKQAVVLNKIQEIMLEKGQLDGLRLKETLGHTKQEITVGVLIGIAVSLIVKLLIMRGL